MLDDSDCPPCVIDGCDDPRYRDFDRCHWHHREQRLPLPPGMSPAPSTGAAWHRGPKHPPQFHRETGIPRRVRLVI